MACTTRAWPGADGADHLNGFGQVMSYVSDRFKGGGIWNRNGYDIYMYIYVHMYIYIYINVYIYICVIEYDYLSGYHGISSSSS